MRDYTLRLPVTGSQYGLRLRENVDRSARRLLNVRFMNYRNSTVGCCLLLYTHRLPLVFSFLPSIFYLLFPTFNLLLSTSYFLPPASCLLPQLLVEVVWTYLNFVLLHFFFTCFTNINI